MTAWPILILGVWMMVSLILRGTDEDPLFGRWFMKPVVYAIIFAPFVAISSLGTESWVAGLGAAMIVIAFYLGAIHNHKV